MLFHSVSYLGFLAVVVAAYLLLQIGRRHREQNLLLLAASYFFYGSWSAPFCLLLLGSTLIDHAAGRHIGTAKTERGRRAWMWTSVGSNLGLLAYFKYRGFFAAELRDLLGGFGLELSFGAEHLLLPLGISFYTFQSMGYAIDVYRGRVRPEANFVDFALFIAFFPQLLAGPIERASHLLPQIKSPRDPTWAGFRSGSFLILLGLYKKVFIADQLVRFVDPLFAPRESHLSGDVAAAALLFGVQIYTDFSGYSDIARGSARLLGFDLLENFRAPFFARNVQEYWHRWHISLSSWIRDYLYLPLALHPRLSRGLGAGGIAMVSLVAMGFWHGAEWHFVAWGAYMGFLLLVYGSVRGTVFRLLAPRPAWVRRSWQVGRIVLTFTFVILGEILFRAPDMGQAGAMYAGLFGNPGSSRGTGPLLLESLWICAPLLVLEAAEFRTDDHEVVLRWPYLLRRLVQWTMAMSIVGALIAGSTALKPYEYLRF